LDGGPASALSQLSRASESGSPPGMTLALSTGWASGWVTVFLVLENCLSTPCTPNVVSVLEGAAPKAVLYFVQFFPRIKRANVLIPSSWQIQVCVSVLLLTDAGKFCCLQLPSKKNAFVFFVSVKS
jgi:hypothetical protein